MNPIILYYNILFVLSTILLILLILRWRVQLDVDMTVLFTLVPITLIGYIRLAVSTNVETAVLATQIVYLGGCFLQLLIFLTVCTLCHIRFHRLIRALLFTLGIILYSVILSIGRNQLFYKSYHLETQYGVSVLVKEYGPVHNMFYALLLLYVFLSLVMLYYCYRHKRNEVSTRNLMLLSLIIIIATILFFGARFITRAVEVAPLTYIVAEIGFLMIAYRLRLYNISGNIANSVLENGSDGLICLDMKRNLLVYNNTALNIIPALGNVRIDHQLDPQEPIFHRLNSCIDVKESGQADSDINMLIGNNIYRVRTEYLQDNKEISGYYIVLADITAEQRYLENMNKVNAELEEAKNAAEAADAAKTQFLAQMSHEIRTPINAVLGMNEMIMQESKDPVILDYAEGIRSSGHNLLFLINSILDFSKIEDGKMEIILEEYDTVKLIMNLVNSMQGRAEAKNLKLNISVDSNLPVSLIGDDVRISQVVLNLLSNAVKYTDEGHVDLNISCRRSDIPEHIILHVEVRDTGIGIHPEDMDRLFDEFTRLDEIRNHKKEGTGLGMPIICKLLELMGSHINVESTYGEGSYFWFDLDQTISDPTPVGDYRERARIASMRSKQEITLNAPDARVLVVDDNALNLKVTRGYLKVCGIVPDEAMSGPDALELIRMKEYDVVLMDHMMPGMDGIETLKKIREEDLAGEHTIMVVLTANAIEGSRELYAEAGFDDYISKPVDLKTLAAKLESYLTKQ